MAEINIQNIGFSNISRADIEKHFAVDKRLDKILLIFDKINSLDGKSDEVLSKIDLSEMKQVKSGIWSDGQPQKAFLEKNYDGKINDYELTEYFKKAKEFYGKDIELDDYRKFLDFAASKGDKAYAKILEETSKKTGITKEIIEKLGGPYMVESYKAVTRNGKQCFERSVDGFKELRDSTGNLLERREAESSSIDYIGCEEITTYDSDGENSQSFINHKTGEQTQFRYGKNPDDKSYKLHIKDGIAVKQSHTGTDDPSWKNMKLEDIIFNAGKVDSAKVSFKYNENNQLIGIDIKDNTPEDDKPRGFTTDGEVFLTHIPQKTSIDETTVQAIKQMIDAGARYGEDFDLKITDGKLQVMPKIKNETGKEAPELKGAAFEKYKDLVAKGIHNEEDFEVEYDKNGNFKYNFKNNQAREFDADFKSETYDKDGNLISSLTVRAGEAVKEQYVNGQIQKITMPLDDVLMELSIQGDFKTAADLLGDNNFLSGGYDIYPLAEKYKETTGRELIADVYDSKQIGAKKLMGKLCPQGCTGYSKESVIESYHQGYDEFKAIRGFDPYMSQIADLLPKIKRTELDVGHFIEKVNNNSFEVKINNDKLTITKNDEKELSIDISKIPKNYILNTISKLNTSVLYDIAATGTKITFDEDMNKDSIANKTNGYYSPTDRTITIDPNATIGDRALKTLTHEAGHMCDCIDDRENAIKALKEQLKDPFINFGNDKPLTVNELLQKQGTLQPVSIADEKLKDIFSKELAKYRKNPPVINSNAEYALTSTVEFFAESYSLLNKGDCKSEYVIANYFQESLTRVKEIMESNRTIREQ